MKPTTSILLLFSLLIVNVTTSLAQNQDSIKAYIREFIEPEVNYSVMYSTGCFSLEYVEHLPLNEKSEEFIENQKKEYETTKDPMALFLIGQTYRRMNQKK